MSKTFWGESSGVRALLRHQYELDRSQGKASRLWAGETVSDFKNTDLDNLLQRQDLPSTQFQTSGYRHELAETYALRRDTTYATRSRRWLFTRGLRSKLDASYNRWWQYQWLNSGLPETEDLVDSSPDVLRNKTFEELLDYTPATPPKT